ncbi:MAG: hypothetical protein QOE45_1296 [Frankiaceae bacterium]|jgi:hypothetical protein|nr:hypothetical protein [Frankiaceae bacterium]
MLTAIVLRDDELAALTPHEALALEHLLHDRLSEVARTRKSGDSSLLLAIKAADYLSPLLDELGDAAAMELVDAVANSDLGRLAFERATAVAALTAPHAA